MKKIKIAFPILFLAFSSIGVFSVEPYAIRCAEAFNRNLDYGNDLFQNDSIVDGFQRAACHGAALVAHVDCLFEG
ncbi:MAG: hypothetical protein CR997_00525 [Acidobacteria bacterium]|nr:MAG: hypothetical protein CR997_00525 [Acidobacteriota bacterium]